MIIGNLAPRVLEVPMLGRPNVVAQLLDTDGAAFAITGTYKVVAEFRVFADDAAALITKVSITAGEIILAAATGVIYIPLSPTDVTNLPRQGVSNLLVKLVRVSDGTTVDLVNVFYLVPLNQIFNWKVPA